MNLPFRFSAANATDILTLNDETANLVLNGIKAAALTEAQKARFSLLAQPLVPGWLVSIDVTANKDATVDFGCYDGSVFYPVYSAQLLAAGDNTFNSRLNTGLYVPLGGAVVPAIKVIVGTAVILTGHIEILPNPSDSATPFTPAPGDDE